MRRSRRAGFQPAFQAWCLLLLFTVLGASQAFAETSEAQAGSLPTLTERPRRVVVQEQYGENATYIYRNDDNFDAFFDNEIDSIQFSCFDLEFNEYPYPVTQYVYARDSVYVLPLECVDSIGLHTPTPKLNKQVHLLTYDMLNYIVERDSCTVTFAPNTPVEYLAKEGDVIYSTPVPYLLPDGIAGRVTNVTITDAGYLMYLDLQLSGSDIYERLVYAGELQTINGEDENGDDVTRLILRSSLRRDPTKDKEQQAPTVTPSGFFDQVKEALLGKGFDIELVYDGEVDGPNGLKLGMSVGFTKNLTSNSTVEGRFGPYVRLVTRHFPNIGGNSDLSKVVAGIYLGMGGSVKGTFSGKKTIIDPDKFNDPILNRLGSIPVFGAVYIGLDLVRPLLKVEGGFETKFELEGEVGLQISRLINSKEGVKDDECTGAGDQKDCNFDWNIRGKLTARGNVTITAGIEPNISISIINKNIISLVLAGLFGVKVDGNVSVSTDAVAEAVVNGWERNKAYTCNDYYITYLNNYANCGLKICPTGTISLKLKILKGLLKEIKFFEISKDLDTTRDIPVLGALVPEVKTSFQLTLSPEFTRPTVEFVTYDPATGLYSYKVTYKATGRTLMDNELCLAVCGEYDKEPTVYKHNNGTYKALTTTSQTNSFIVKLRMGHTYYIYPAIGKNKYIDDWIHFAYPLYVYTTAPKVTTGGVENIDPTETRIYGSRMDGYTDVNKAIGIVYVDAGTVNDQKADDIVFSKIPAKNLNITIAKEEERQRAVQKGSFDVTLRDMKPGHKYFYAAFYSKTDVSLINKDYVTFESLGSTSVFIAEGHGLEVFNVSTGSMGEDWISCRGGFLWTRTDIIKEEDIKAGLEYRVAGEIEWKEANLLDDIPVKNNTYFKVKLGNLISNTTYEYRFYATHVSEFTDFPTYYSDILTVKTKAEPSTILPGTTLVHTLEGELVDVTATTAKFQLRADWYQSDPNEKVELGIIWRRRDIKAPFPKYNYDKMWVTSGNKRKAYGEWVGSDGVERYTNYSSKRGQVVEVSLADLRPEDPGFVYYWRPYMIIHNDAIQEKADNFDIEWDDDYDIDGKCYAVYHGEIQKFNTRGKNSSNRYDFVTDTKQIGEGAVFGAALEGMINAKRVGFYVSMDDKAGQEGSSSIFVRGRVRSLSYDKLPPRHRAALARLNGEEYDEAADTLAARLKGPAVNEDFDYRIEEINFTDPMQGWLDVDDEELNLSELADKAKNCVIDMGKNAVKLYEAFHALGWPVRKGTKLTVRAAVENEKDQIAAARVFHMVMEHDSDFDFTIDDDIHVGDMGDVPLEWLTGETGEPVDLGLPSGLKWCSTNLGAETMIDYGDYYAWGETETKERYLPTYYEYPYADENPGLYHDLHNTEYDVARKRLGNAWFMPSRENWEELRRECEWAWSNINGIHGYLVQSKKNDNVIFLPAAGVRYDKSVYSNDKCGCYWASDCVKYEPAADDKTDYNRPLEDEKYDNFVRHREAWRLHIDKPSENEYGHYEVSGGSVYFGRSVRPVTYTAK